MSCPICAGATAEKWRPFCSKRCADLDLARWLNGSYAVPSTRESDPDEVIDALEEAARQEAAPGPQKPH